MAKLSPSPIFRAFDNNGDPLAGGKLYTYEAGTSTPKVTYTDAGEGTPNANPVILDANGEADIWLGEGAYKFVLDSASDVNQWTVDNIVGDTASAFGSAFVTTSTNLNITSVYENNIVICTAALTLSLLPAATAGSGFYFIVKNTGSGDVTIDPDASELIDGGSTYVLKAGGSISINCDGTQWRALFDGKGLISNNNTWTGANTFTGALTKSNNTFITGRNAADNANVNIIKVNASDEIELGGQLRAAGKIVNVTNPTADQDAATKKYVDDEIAAIPLATNRVYTEITTRSTITDIIPLDNTIPQNTEGLEVFSETITPSSATSKIRIKLSFICSATAAARWAIAAIFRDSGTDAIITESVTIAGNGYATQFDLEFEDSPATTSAVTYSARVGCNTTGIFFNGSSVDYFGLTQKAIFIIEEIKL